MNAPLLTAVAVAWNSGDGLPECLGALRRSAAAAGAELELVIVDNASSDGSPDAALAAGAAVVVRNPLNVGFAAAAAQGIERARTPWVLLVNPDLAVDEGFVGALLAAAAAAPPEVAVLVPDIRYASEPDVVNCRGIVVDAIGIPAERMVGAPAETPAAAEPVFGGVSGGCAFRTSALRAIGGPEPCFFAFLEDVDVAWRLNRAGYTALVVPGAVALHEGSASVGEGSRLKSWLVARNRRLLFRLHGPRSPRARAWRAVTELGHGIVVSAWGGGAVPWTGRLAALRMRRYTSYLVRSRRLAGGEVEPVALAPRVGLLATLSRKRAAARRMRQAR